MWAGVVEIMKRVERESGSRWEEKEWGWVAIKLMGGQ